MLKKAIFFDWTGTLADERELDKAVCESMERLISTRKKIPLHQARTRYRDLLKNLAGTWQWYSYPLHGRIFDIDWKKAQMINLSKIKLIPSAREILEYAKAKGYYVCLLTNAAKEVIKLRTDFLRISDLFDLIVGSDSVEALKSEGKHFQIAMKTLPINPASSFSVGDNFVEDIEPACARNMKTVFCELGDHRTYYHENSGYFENQHQRPNTADFTIRDLSELKRII